MQTVDDPRGAAVAVMSPTRTTTDADQSTRLAF